MMKSVPWPTSSSPKPTPDEVYHSLCQHQDFDELLKASRLIIKKRLFPAQHNEETVRTTIGLVEERSATIGPEEHQLKTRFEEWQDEMFELIHNSIISNQTSLMASLQYYVRGLGSQITDLWQIIEDNSLSTVRGQTPLTQAEDLLSIFSGLKFMDDSRQVLLKARKARMQTHVSQDTEGHQMEQRLDASDVSTALARYTPKRVIDTTVSNPPDDLRPNKRMKALGDKAESEGSPTHSRQLRKGGVSQLLDFTILPEKMQLSVDGSVSSNLELPDRPKLHERLQDHANDHLLEDDNKATDTDPDHQGNKTSVNQATGKPAFQEPNDVAGRAVVVASPCTLSNEILETSDVRAESELPPLEHPAPQLAKPTYDADHVRTTTTTDAAVRNDAILNEHTTEATSTSQFPLPSRASATTNAKAKIIPPDADIVGALTSLEPKHPISATAIQMILDTFASAGCRVLDPLFLNTNKGASKPPALRGLDPQVERLIVPLHHDKAQHWTLACIEITSHKIRHYDSLPLKSGNRVRRILEDFASSLNEHSNQPWVTVTEPFCRQNNSFDCGIYVLVAAIFLMAQQQPPTDLHDCSPWRLIFRAMFQEADSEIPTLELQLSDQQSSAIAQSITLLVGDKGRLSLSQFEQYANNAKLALNKDEIAVRAGKTSVNHLSSTIDTLKCSLADVEAALTKTILRVNTLEQKFAGYQVLCTNYNLLLNEGKGLQPALNEETKVIENKLRKTEGLRRSLEQRRDRIKRGLGTAEAISTLSAQKHDAILQSLRDAKGSVGEHRTLTLRVADMLAGLDEKLTRNLEGFGR